MIHSLDEFDEIVVADSEYTARPGEIQEPLCVAFHELRSGRREVVLRDDLRRLPAAPFTTGGRALLVGHYVSAEIATMLALGWPLPTNVICTFAEFRVLTNADPRLPAGLLSAAAHFGISTMAESAKEAMRALAMRGELTPQEAAELGDYCLADVDATVGVLKGLIAKGLDLPRALVRGQFMVAAARSEAVGLPVDRDAAQRIVGKKHAIERAAIAELDRPGLFDDTHLRQDRIGRFARARGLLWPRTPSGRFVTDRDTIEELAALEPDLLPIVELLDVLAALRQVELPVGADGRARAGLGVFRTKTGRGAPAAREFLLAQADWRRALVRPPEGRALAYLDFAQQEFGVAAALSQDEQMWADYRSGDPYLALAKRFGRVPRDATKASHPEERARFKSLILGLQYSMSAHGLAQRLGVRMADAERYLAMHRTAYARFWAWNDAYVFLAQDRGIVRTTFGWAFRPSSRTNPRTLRNWAMQAHGADILRLAMILGWERGVTICAPIHDAVLIEADNVEITYAVARMRRAMVEASIAVIGRPLDVSAEIIGPSTRWISPRSRPTWERVIRVLGSQEAS